MSSAEAMLEEAVTLRMLRLPRLATVLDQGVHDGRAFVVLPLVDGTPFPGDGDRAWTRVAPAVLSLLEVVDAVHCAGLVHGDLKPANVLVRAEGRCTVLDFGLARRYRAFERDASNRTGGTPAYAAPELIRGAPMSPASDLYSVGVMIFEALTGELPHPGSTAPELFFARLTTPARRLGDFVAGASAQLEVVLGHMLDSDPACRPSSSRGALEELAGRSVGPAAPDELDVADAASLAGLFVGEDRIFHERSDAALALITVPGVANRTRRLSSVLDDWVGRDLARRTGDRYHVSRECLGQLALARRARPVGMSIGEHAHRAGRVALAEGDTQLAATCFEEAARASRDMVGEASVPLFVDWLDAIVAEQSPTGADRLRYELARTNDGGPAARTIDALATAVVTLSMDPLKALAALDDWGPMPIADLERLRSAIHMIAARSGTEDDEARVLEGVESRIARFDDAHLSARVTGWRGRLAYRRGLFEEAARLHLEAAKTLDRPADVAAALLNAAAATLEVFRPEEVLGLVGRARTSLGSVRHPLLEARAEWLTRSARYRCCHPLAPDLELIDAVGLLGVSHLEAQVAFTEAAFAWRGEQMQTAIQLARRAEELWRRTRTLVDFAWLARALRVAAGDRDAAASAAEIAHHAIVATAPGAGIQALALLGERGGAIPEVALAQVARLAASVPAGHHGMRIDVLSVDESLHALRR